MQTRPAIELTRFGEALHEHAAIRFNHTLRRHVVRVSRDLNVGQTHLASLGQQLFQGARRLAQSTPPRHHRIANVTQHMWWQVGRSGRPAQADAAA